MPAYAIPRLPNRGLQLAEQSALVVFRDQTELELQHVTQHGTPARMLRAIRAQQGRAVVDLSKLGRDLDNELRLAAERDADGLLLFTLRQRFPTASDARAAMAQHTVITLPEA